jgi:light-regulated signal transduction histidine kinase (bacteriophytochrome)
MSASEERRGMEPTDHESSQTRRFTPRWIALAYLALGVLWIFGTDRLLLWLDLPPAHVAQMQMSKGWLFVLASSVLLYVLLSIMQRRQDAALRALSERESEIRRMNAELERRVAQRTEQLEAMNRELESFAYAVSHDLRAPLRSMSGFSQLLQDNPSDALDEKSRHYLKRINDASRRMSALIEDLLSLSRISRSELSPRTVDLSQLVNDVATTIRERYPQHQVDLHVETGMLVQADPRLLRIAIENLLDNAWKYTRYAEQPQVRVGSQTSDDGQTYYVRDNGIGFDMAYSSKLFGPFQRLHADPDYPGTGIGLVTVQRILARHGGRIWVHAEPNRGATFYFTFGTYP